VTIATLLGAPHRDARRARLVWSIVAAACVLAAIWLAAYRSNDFWEVRGWIERWRTGADVYAADLWVDYPPWALPVLAWMAWLPHDAAPLVMALLNAALSLAATALLVAETDRLAALGMSRTARAAWTMLLLAMPAVRLNIWLGQTTPIAVCLICLASRWSATRPWIAGLCLGLGAFKPRVAAGVMFVLLLEGRIATITAAAGTVIALAWAYASSVHLSLVTVIGEYAGSLRAIYQSPEQLPSGLDVHQVVLDVLGPGHAADAVFWTIALAAVTALAWNVWRARGATAAPAWTFAMGFVCSLLIFPSRRYSLLVIGPMLLLLSHRVGDKRRSLAWFASLMALLLIDVPLTVRLVLDHVWPSADWLARIAMETNRALVLGLFVTGLWVLTRSAALARHAESRAHFRIS